MKIASLVSPCEERQVPPRTIAVRGRKIRFPDLLRTASGMGLSLGNPTGQPTKNPDRTGQGCFDFAPRPFSGLFNVAASRSAQISTNATRIPPGRPAVKPIRNGGGGRAAPHLVERARLVL